MRKIFLISISLLIFSCDEEPDCAGVPGGSASLDDCSICTGGTTGLIANHLKDCAGECNGESIEDCIGVCGGTASIDDCGLCTGGTTNLEVNYLKDDCGLCNGDNSTCSIYGIWRSTEGQYCEYSNDECINCENKFGETEPSDINIIEQSLIFSVSETSFNFDWCYSYDGYDEEWCNDNDSMNDFNCIWDELNNFSTTCVSLESEVVSIGENELCIQDIEEECFDFSITNSGNNIVLTGITSWERCYTIVATRD